MAVATQRWFLPPPPAANFRGEGENSAFLIPEDKGRYLLVGERVLSHPVGSLGGGTEGRPWASCKRPERRVCPLSSSAAALRFRGGPRPWLGYPMGRPTPTRSGGWLPHSWSATRTRRPRRISAT